MRGTRFAFGYGCGDRLLPVAVMFALFMVGLTTVAAAQRIIVEIRHPITVTPIVPPTTLSPSLTAPSFKPSIAPVITPYSPAPVIAAPSLAAPAPSVQPAVPVARAVRFRCEVLPQDQSCREHGETPDGDAHDDQCDCSRDYCYPAPDGNRVCEKLQ